jgi:hypothetical protein
VTYVREEYKVREVRVEKEVRVAGEMGGEREVSEW